MVMTLMRCEVVNSKKKLRKISVIVDVKSTFNNKYLLFIAISRELFLLDVYLILSLHSQKFDFAEIHNKMKTARVYNLMLYLCHRLLMPGGSWTKRCLVK